MGVLGRFIFWDYARATWQYDLMVAAILAFIFLTPRDVFRDQPKAASIVMLTAQQSFLIEPKLLDGVPEAQQASQATDLVRKRFKNNVTVTHVEAVHDDAEKEVTGYIAYTK
jgi:hypothetical protein